MVRLNEFSVGECCEDCDSVIADRYFLDIFHEKKRIRVYSDVGGLPLDSWPRACKTADKIKGEIQNGTFDIRNYRETAKQDYSTDVKLDLFWQYELRHIAPASIAPMRAMLNRAKEFFKGRDVRTIRFEDLEQFQFHIEDTHKELKAKTVKKHLTFLRSFLNWAYKRRIVKEVPPLPEIPHILSPKKQYLEKENQLKLVEAMAEGDRPFFHFLLSYGLRPGEVRALQIKDVDLRENKIWISRTFSGKVLHEQRKGLHGKSREFDIFILEELLPFIKERMETDFPEQFLFLNPRNGKPYSTQAIRRLWDKAQTVAGIRCRLYSACRNSVVTQLGLLGVSPLAIARQMGLSSSRVIEENYMSAGLELIKGNVVHLGLYKKSTEKGSVAGVSLGKK
jgi:integrase